MFSVSKTHALLVGAGVVLGAVGVQLLKSTCVRNLAVQGVAAGMRAKVGYQDIVEQAKAEVDDIVAEAGYLNEQVEEAAQADACACNIDA
ncbi:DUF1490 domain-containing protein [Collinsella sp. zg1085]|uniref:DUF6110 family protein n=1 Tax=Collinsella sp. zg1085 TaxID=2844380 RepID=UPI001C0C8A63|nr:DUF6110 family protein [Collinsella sp. zg1085]QWT17757.1 DUF1490 domain-containing protein [Collinsella sp. zg1085]